MSRLGFLFSMHLLVAERVLWPEEQTSKLTPLPSRLLIEDGNCEWWNRKLHISGEQTYEAEEKELTVGVSLDRSSVCLGECSSND